MGQVTKNLNGVCDLNSHYSCPVGQKETDSWSYKKVTIKTVQRYHNYLMFHQNTDYLISKD